MNKYSIEEKEDLNNLKHILKIMRITVFFLFFSILFSQAVNSYSQETKLTLNLKSTSIKEVCRQIERSTDYIFVFSDNSERMMDKKVSVTADSEDIEKVLNNVFSNTGLIYRILDKQIVVYESGERVLAKQVENSTSEITVQQPAKKHITGRIIDVNGEAVIGANVVEAGTTNGTVTDVDGNFSLDVENNATIRVSYIGYLEQGINTAGRNSFNITLIEDMKALEEVVVVGYGTERKRDITGAISSITSKDIGIASLSNTAQLLQGKAAGVMVTSESGSPGSSVNVRIRGIGTVNNNDPLYVIDGIPTNSMSNLNPADIERIEVLKDASSSAIYGSRAANGVVLITTKQGVTGKTRMSFESYMGISNPWKNQNQLSASQYYEMVKLANLNGGTTVTPYLETEFKEGHDTNWWKEIKNQNALTQNYFTSIIGGTSNVRYSFSGGYYKEEGIIRGTDYDRITFRTNSDYDITDRINIGVNINIINKTQNKINEAKSLTGNGIISAAITSDPMVPPRDLNSTDPNEFNRFVTSLITDGAGPLAAISRNFNKNNSFNTLGNLSINFSILNELKLKTSLGINIGNTNTYGFSPKYYLNPRQNNPNSSVSRNYSNNLGLIWENTLSYHKKIQNNHNLSVLLGITSEINSYEGFSGSKQGTPSNDKYFRTLGAATTNDQTTGYKGSSSLLSILGRINYNYKDKYLLTTNIRRDGSSNFAFGHKWGTFPSLSFGWRLSEEDFFLRINQSFVDNLKIRVGWGQIGNQNIASNAYLSLIGGGNFRRYTFGDTVHQGYSPSNIGNPSIQWETVEQKNLALDLNLFKNKLAISIDYFIKDTKDMLLRVPLVLYSGYPSNPWSNAGSVQNKGVEFDLKYFSKISQDFNYDFNLNFSTIKNKVTSLGAGKPIIGGTVLNGSATKTEVGHPIGSFFGYVMDGIFQNEEEIKNGNQPLAKPGDIRFKDLAGALDEEGNRTGPDGKINENDKTYIGSPIPDYTIGFGINMQYKNLDLSMAFQGVFGNDIYSDIKNYTHAILGHYNVNKDAYNAAWRGEGTSDTQPRISTINPNDNYRISSFFVEKGSYLRLKNIQIGYNLPTSFCTFMHLSNVRIFLNGQNIFTITKYSGLDPEIGDGSPLMVGIDYGNYPQPKTLLGGISINF